MEKVFSIIIPCRNEEAHIEKCLQSLDSLDYSRESYEILVVDNGSTDLSVTIAKKYADQIILLPDVKVGAVRNTGAKAATGRYLVFIDADCTLDSNWLARAEKLAKNYPKRVFGGGIILPKNPKWVERYWLLEGPEGNSLPAELIGCSIVICTELFKSIGGFDEKRTSGEDTDISTRIRAIGQEIKITRALNVTHLGNAQTIFSHIKRQAWHAKSYKKNKLQNLKDPVFLLLLTYILSIAFAAITAILEIYLFTPPLFLIALILPLVLTTKRYKRAKRIPGNIKELFLSYILDLSYLTGRAMGYLSPPYR
ncbi:glycosyltransferase [uncultured Marinobacter sp.]|uniref:glycosyltransferase n=1 Tax=uncultured Marinobacter sp. TaxID=187379 RepID=UPI0030D759F2